MRDCLSEILYETCVDITAAVKRFQSLQDISRDEFDLCSLQLLLVRSVE